MKLFILITIIDRNILTSYHKTLKDAQEKMRREFQQYGGTPEKIKEQLASISEFEAWIMDGNNQDDYDWKIIVRDAPESKII